MNFKIDTKEKMHVIMINEDVLSANMAEELEKTCKSFFEQPIKNVVINMTKVSKIDRKIVETFVNLQQSFVENGVSLVYCHLNKEIVNMMKEEEVDDIRAEWLDRYGPVPDPAEALLAVARLRAECVRLGITDVGVAKGSGFGGPAFIAKVSPVDLRTSQMMRLARLVKGSMYKEAQRQLVLPIGKTPELARVLVSTLRELIPPA